MLTVSNFSHSPMMSRDAIFILPSEHLIVRMSLFNCLVQSYNESSQNSEIFDWYDANERPWGHFPANSEYSSQRDTIASSGRHHNQRR